jgi:hypothetical protein
VSLAQSRCSTSHITDLPFSEWVVTYPWYGLVGASSETVLCQLHCCSADLPFSEWVVTYPRYGLVGASSETVLCQLHCYSADLPFGEWVCIHSCLFFFFFFFFFFLEVNACGGVWGERDPYCEFVKKNGEY